MGFFDRFKKKEEGKKVKSNLKKKIEKPVKEDSTLREKSEVAPVAEVKEVKTKKVRHQDTKDAYKVLVRPLITEKATFLVAQNKYAFEVSGVTNKVEVKKAIKNLYGVAPLDVNIIIVRGKNVRYGKTMGRQSKWKKAIVTLKPGDKIEIYEGV